MTETQRGPSWAAVWPFVACLFIVALAGAGLVLTIPNLFTEANLGQWGVAAMLAIMVIGFGLLGRRIRPALAAPAQLIRQQHAEAEARRVEAERARARRAEQVAITERAQPSRTDPHRERGIGF